MRINQTNTESSAPNNSSICTEEWDSDSTFLHLDMCKFYNWMGGMTNLFRKTGEVANEFLKYYGYDYKGPTAVGNQVWQKSKKIFLICFHLINFIQIFETADYVDGSVDEIFVDGIGIRYFT